MRRLLIGTDLWIDQEPDQAFNLDTILLAYFIKVPLKSKTILDFGTGTGALMLYLTKKTKANIIGIEVQTSRYQKALMNIEINDLSKRCSVLHLDLNDLTQAHYQDVDLVVSNPPYFEVKAHQKLSPNQEKKIARHEVLINLETLIQKAAMVLKYGGSFQMIHRPERIAEIIDILKQHNMSVKRLRFVHPYSDKPANHVLIEAVKYGQSGLKLEAPIILYHGKHEITEQLKTIYEGDIYVTQHTQSEG
jgi:tRNA1(Val) A37 N6-methylase TrmN6